MSAKSHQTPGDQPHDDSSPVVRFDQVRPILAAANRTDTQTVTDVLAGLRAYDTDRAAAPIRFQTEIDGVIARHRAAHPDKR